MRKAYERPLCRGCGKLTAMDGASICRPCADAEGIKVCLVCGCRKGLNFENCRACDLAVRIAILRTRARKQWLQLKSALKEMFHGQE